MKVLLTGYAGFLGRHIAGDLAAKGWQVRVIMHSMAVRRRDFNPGFEILWGDISDPKTIGKAVEGVDAVVHSAWVWPHSVGTNDSLNADIVGRLWDRAIASGVSKFVFISSVAVYGMQKRNGLIDETQSPTSGQGLEPPYPRHKVEAENVLLERSRTQQQMKLAILRPGILIDDVKGPARMLGTIALGFGNGRNHLPYICASDIADAIVRWLELGKESAIYNVTPSRSIPAREWYRRWATARNKEVRPLFVRPFVMLGAGLGITMLKRVLGKKASMLGFKYAMSSATRNLRYSNERLKRDLGWQDTETTKYFSEGA